MSQALYSPSRTHPLSVHVSWAAYFQNLESGVDSSQAFSPPPLASMQMSPMMTRPAAAPMSSPMVSDSLGVSYLIRAYQARRHGTDHDE